MKIYPVPVTVLSLLVSLHIFAQGSLTPPGAPSPTMKSLDQVEPRTPVDATHTPGSGNEQFIISQPGAYYLTTNIYGVSGKDGIEIATNNVTLDLNGFALFGAASPTTSGIYIPDASSVMICNGIISGWAGSGSSGVYCVGKNALIERLIVSSGFVGIFCGGGCTVRNCLVYSNASYGIDINGNGSLVLDNNLIGNNTGTTTSSLVAWGSNNRFEGNHVTGVGVSGGYGIEIRPIISFTNNIVIRNSVEGGGANNYFFNTSQIVGPLVTNTVSGVITNLNPWANFSF